MDQMLVMGGGTMMGGMQQGMLSSVNLGEMLQVMADRTENFQKLLVEPRSVVSLMTDNHCFITICHFDQFFFVPMFNRAILYLQQLDLKSL
jgi:hypothetical protein